MPFLREDYLFSYGTNTVLLPCPARYSVTIRPTKISQFHVGWQKRETRNKEQLLFQFLDGNLHFRVSAYCYFNPEATFFQRPKTGPSYFYFHRNGKSHAPDTKISPMPNLGACSQSTGILKTLKKKKKESLQFLSTVILKNYWVFKLTFFPGWKT